MYFTIGDWQSSPSVVAC